MRVSILKGSLVVIVSAACANGAQPASDPSAVDAGERDAARPFEPGASSEDAGLVVGPGSSGGPAGDGGGPVDDGGSSGGSSLVINEVDYDNVGTDSAEFVEIFNPTSAAVQLANLTLVLVSGSTSSEYGRVDLTGSVAAGGYVVVASATVTVASGAAVIHFPAASNNLRNTTAAVGILDTTSGKLVDALSYAGSVKATVGDGGAPLNFVQGTAASAVDSNTSDGSLVRKPNGSNTGDADTDWAFTTKPTPGAANKY